MKSHNLNGMPDLIIIQIIIVRSDKHLMKRHEERFYQRRAIDIHVEILVTHGNNCSNDL